VELVKGHINAENIKSKFITNTRDI
jgi:hypothetical protein